MANEHNKLTGMPSMAYLGVGTQPIQLVYNTKDPVPNDKKNYLLGTLWVNRSTSIVWMLVSLEGNTAVWIRFYASVAMALYFATQTGISVPDGAGMLFIPNGTLISTSTAAPHTVSIDITNGGDGQIVEGLGGAGPTWGDITSRGGTIVVLPNAFGFPNTINLEVVAPAPVTFKEDAGNAQAVADQLKVVGDGTVVTSGAGNTITLSIPSFIAGLTFRTQAGDAHAAANILNMYGAAPAVTSAGAGNTVTFNLVPQVGRTITNVAFMAYLDHEILNSAGGSLPIRYLPANVELFDLGNNYDNASFTFTAPYNGRYYFVFAVTISHAQVINGGNSFIDVMINGALNSNLEDIFMASNAILNPALSGSVTIKGNLFIALNAGFTVKCRYVYTSNAPDAHYAGNATYGHPVYMYTYFGGYLVYQ